MFVDGKRSLHRGIWFIGGAVGLLTILLLVQPETCYACGSQTPPPTCTANMSSMTMRQGDNQQPWWGALANLLDRREEQTVRVYLGLNMNGGATDAPYTYEIVADGDWMPQGTFPITGTGVLTPRQRNQTIQIDLPYTQSDAGTLKLTATVDSACSFAPAPATTQVQLNPTGPTVWPITSRACPVAGDKQVFRFGVRNPANSTQSYIVRARARTQFGGEHTPILNENQGDPGSAQLPMLTLGPNESRRIEVTCETFGFCLTGSESKVELDVQPLPGGAEDFPGAVATSNITLRDPETTCVAPEDWRSILSPLLLGLMVSVPLLLATVGGGAWYTTRRRNDPFPPPPPDDRLPPKKPRPVINTDSITNVKPRGGSGSGGSSGTQID